MRKWLKCRLILKEARRSLCWKRISCFFLWHPENVAFCFHLLPWKQQKFYFYSTLISLANWRLIDCFDNTPAFEYSLYSLCCYWHVRRSTLETNSICNTFCKFSVCCLTMNIYTLSTPLLYIILLNINKYSFLKLNELLLVEEGKIKKCIL